MPLSETILNAKFWEALPTLIWAAALLILARTFREELKALLQNVIWRLRTGAAIKIASFELGQSYISPGVDIAKAGGAAQFRTDENGSRFRQREQYYKPNRNVQLVHRLAPSTKPGQLYDILIYLVPHQDATLEGVQQVEYYFGRHWGNGIFTSLDRARGFAVSTSAYGPFMCTAEIHFSDGDVATIGRHIDFDMGALGAQAAR